MTHNAPVDSRLGLRLDYSIPVSRPDLFWAKVDRTGDCWEWTGGRNAGGYGVVARLRAGRRLHFMAHKVAYLLTGRVIPEGQEIDHLCRNPICVRPDHLEVVTPWLNKMRGSGPSAVNLRKTHCIRGHELEDGFRDHRGDRRCRICTQMHNREARRRRRTE